MVLVGSGSGQEEPGMIMRVKLATGNGPEEKAGNCPHQSKIKAFFQNRDRMALKKKKKKKKKKPITPN